MSEFSLPVYSIFDQKNSDQIISKIGWGGAVRGCEASCVCPLELRICFTGALLNQNLKIWKSVGTKSQLWLIFFLKAKPSRLPLLWMGEKWGFFLLFAHSDMRRFMPPWKCIVRNWRMAIPNTYALLNVYASVNNVDKVDQAKQEEGQWMFEGIPMSSLACLCCTTAPLILLSRELTRLHCGEWATWPAPPLCHTRGM